MVNVVSLIMKCAIKGNALRDNPAAGHELRVRKTRVSQAAMLTMDQAVKVVGHTSRHYQPAMWLLLFTGLRPAELCGAKVTDLDFERRVLHAGPTHSLSGRTTAGPESTSTDRPSLTPDTARFPFPTGSARLSPLTSPTDQGRSARATTSSSTSTASPSTETLSGHGSCGRRSARPVYQKTSGRTTSGTRTPASSSTTAPTSSPSPSAWATPTRR